MTSSTVGFQIGPELFPVVYKDVESGVYVAEVMAPPSSEALSHCQVLIDTNSVRLIQGTDLLRRLNWWNGLGTVTSVNPAFAFIEQFLSNRAQALRKMRELEDSLAPIGIFPRGYASNLHAELSGKEASLRWQVGVNFCYLALIEHWERHLRKDGDAAVSQWIALFHEDVPRLKLFYLLGGLFAISGEDESLRIRGSDKSVASWRQALCSDREEEKDDYPRRLRNRSFDLMYFLLAPLLTFAEDGGLESRVVLTTEDRFLAEFISRLFCWIHAKKGSLWALRFLPEKLVSKRQQDRAERLLGQLVNEDPSARSYQDQLGERDRKLENLKRIAFDLLTPEHRARLEQALSEYGH